VAVLVGYGRLLGHWPSNAMAVLVLVGWLAGVGWRGYRALRQVVEGLDQMALSLALFAVAVLISLGKAGVLSRWLAARGLAAPVPARPDSGQAEGSRGEGPPPA
jgi:hypothetical protein